MARLRFPGRPGLRFDRAEVQYGIKSAGNDSKQTTQFIDNIHRGLKNFHELFGESDEEEDFLGFTKRDIRKAEKHHARVAAALAALQDTKPSGGRNRNKALPPQKKSERTITELVKHGLAKQPKESLTRRVLDAQHKRKEKELEKRRKWELKQAEKKAAEDKTKPLAKLKAIKIRLGSDGKGAKIVRSPGRPSIYEKRKSEKDEKRRRKKKERRKRGRRKGGEEEDESEVDTDTGSGMLYSLGDVEEEPPKRRRRGRAPKLPGKTITSKVKSIPAPTHKVRTSALAKQLLTKAKHTNKLLRKPQISPKDAVKKKPVRRRQFVIPSVSSRSARKITPNKRFFDESFSNVALRQLGADDDVTPSPSNQKVPVQGRSALGRMSTDSNLSQKNKKGLFDLPAIVEGKRERRPSMKLIRKLADEDEPQSLLYRRLSDESPRKPSKLESSPEANPTVSSFTKQQLRVRSVSSSERRRGERSGRFRGVKLGHTAILQKAKFRLNQAALNRSKVALAKTLRREMSREDEQKGFVGNAGEKDGGNEAGKVVSNHPQFGAVPLSAPPVSPIKIGMKKEPVKFGSSGLPQVPTFTLKSATATLPTFQSAKLKAAEQEKSDSDSTKDRRSNSYLRYDETGCRICGDPYVIRINYRGQVICQSCMRFYRGTSHRVRADVALPKCKGEVADKCKMKIERKLNNCPPCRWKLCMDLFGQMCPPTAADHAVAAEKLQKLSAQKSPSKRQRSKSQKAKDADDSNANGQTQKSGDKICKADKKQKGDIAEEVEADGTDSVARQKKTAGETKPQTEPNSENVATASLVKVGSRSPAMATPETPMVTKALEQGIMGVVPLAVPSTGTATSQQRSPLTPSSANALSLASSPESEVSIASSRSGHGPRIKHVCRRASVALGQTATFPTAQLRLSALPVPEKEKILKKDGEEPGSDSDQMDIDEIIRQARDDKEEVLTMKKTSTKPFKLLHKVLPSESAVPKGAVRLKRAMRCKRCAGCMAVDCRKCAACQDMKRYGGPGKWKKTCPNMSKYGGSGTTKQACLQRRCLNPLMFREATSDKLYAVNRKGVISPSKERARHPSYDCDPSFYGESARESRAFSLRPKKEKDFAKIEGDDEDDGDFGDDSYARDGDGSNGVQGRGEGQRSLSRNVASSSTRAVEAQKLPSHPSGGAASRCGQRIPTKRLFGVSPRKDPAGRNRVLRQRWPSHHETNHVISANFQETFDIDEAWHRGVALVSSTATCLRTVCLLCGSGGQHELLYCNVCCEPFHSFCLEDSERPHADNTENWVCRRCKFCHVCAQQNNLLQCDKCQETYHPECLGPNYPTGPSRHKNIWVCTKCVRCKSCGATTPGKSKEATWMYDFQLCYDCGKLMDKGNYCPVCHKCYTDDDWETKMIQCSTCDSWVHARCEDLTDEMYEIVSYLPEDVPFNCRICSPQVAPGKWHEVVRREMEAGFKLIMSSLLTTKGIHQLESIKDEAASTPQSTRPSPRASQSRDNKPTSSPPSVPPPQPTRASARLAKDKKSPDEDVGKDVSVENESSEAAAAAEVASSLSQPELMETEPALDSSKTVGAEDDVVKTAGAAECHSEKMTSDSREVKGQTEQTPNNDVIADSDDKIIEGKDSTDDSTVISMQSENSSHTAGASVCSEQRSENSVQAVENSMGDSRQVVEPATVTSEAAVLTKDCIENDAVKASNSTETSTTVIRTKSVENSTESSTATVSNTDSAQNPDTGKSSETLSVAITEDESRVDKPKTTPNGTLLSPTSDSGSSETNSHSTLASRRPSKESYTTDTASETMNMETEMVTSGTALEAPFGRSLSGLEIVPYSSPGQREQFLLRWQNRTAGPGSETKPPKEIPRDLKAVRAKMENCKYKTVREFVDDVVRILRHNLDLQQVSATKKRSSESARSVFAKELQSCFPWFKMNTARLWEYGTDLPEGMLPGAVLPPSNDHTYAQWMTREGSPTSPQPSPFKRLHTTPIKTAESILKGSLGYFGLEPGHGEDTRRCCFCGTLGDEKPNECGRLVYAGQDDWVHVNCALWSAEVYEEVDGTLQNVHTAIGRGKHMKCDECGKSGATVGCCHRGCSANFHFRCARCRGCHFQEDKKVFCWQHHCSIDMPVVKDGKFGVLRRACVELKDSRWLKKTWQKGLKPSCINIVAGSMTVESLGRLTYLSDCPNALYPVDYCVTRVYWSTFDARRRCVYTCRIIQVQPRFEEDLDIPTKDLTVTHDPGHPEYDATLSLKYTTPRVSPPIRKTLKGDDNNEKDADIDTMCRSEGNTNDTSLLQFTVSAEHPFVGSPEQERMLERRNKGETVDRTAGRKSLGSLPSEKHRRNLDFSPTPRLSASWPSVKSPRPPPPPRRRSVDLSVLSEKTRKLIGSANVERYSKEAEDSTLRTCSKDDDLALTKVVQRLNNAAARSREHSRSRSREPSIEKGPASSSDEGSLVARPLMGRSSQPIANMSTKAAYHTPKMHQSGGFEVVCPLSEHGSRDHLQVTDSLSRKIESIASLVVDSDHSEDTTSEKKSLLTLTNLAQEASAANRICNSVSEAATPETSVSGDTLRTGSNQIQLDSEETEADERWLKLSSSDSELSDIGAPSQLDGIDDRLQSSQRLTRRTRRSMENSTVENSTVENSTAAKEIPLRDKIVEKIKAESLARSTPSEQGPFKCQSCKRKYRTKESLSKHVQFCDFEVSTSSGEDDEEESCKMATDSDWAPGATQKPRSPAKRYPLRKGEGLPTAEVVERQITRNDTNETPHLVNTAPLSSSPPLPLKRGRGRPPKRRTASGGLPKAIAPQRERRVLRSRRSVGPDQPGIFQQNQTVALESKVSLMNLKVELQKLDMVQLEHLKGVIESHGETNGPEVDGEQDDGEQDGEGEGETEREEAQEATNAVEREENEEVAEDGASIEEEDAEQQEQQQEKEEKEEEEEKMEEDVEDEDELVTEPSPPNEVLFTDSDEEIDESVNDPLITTIASQLSQSDLDNSMCTEEGAEDCDSSSAPLLSETATPKETVLDLESIAPNPSKTASAIYAAMQSADSQELVESSFTKTVVMDSVLAGKSNKVSAITKETALLGNPAKKLPLIIAKPAATETATARSRGRIFQQKVAGRSVKVVSVSPWQIKPKISAPPRTTSQQSSGARFSMVSDIHSAQVIQEGIQLAGTNFINTGSSMSQLVNSQLQMQGMVSTQIAGAASGSYTHCSPIVNIQQAQNMTVVNNVVNVLAPGPIPATGVSIPLGTVMSPPDHHLPQPCISNITVNSSNIQGQTQLVQTGHSQHLIHNQQQLVQTGSCQPQLIQSSPCQPQLVQTSFSPPGAVISSMSSPPQQGNLVQVLSGQTQRPVMVQTMSPPMVQNLGAPLVQNMTSPIMSVQCNQLSPPLLAQPVAPQQATTFLQASNISMESSGIVSRVVPSNQMPTSDLGILRASERLVKLSQNIGATSTESSKPRTITIAAPRSSILPRTVKPIEQSIMTTLATSASSATTASQILDKVKSVSLLHDRDRASLIRPLPGRKVEERVVIKAGEPDQDANNEFTGEKIAAVQPMVVRSSSEAPLIRVGHPCQKVSVIEGSVPISSNVSSSSAQLTSTEPCIVSLSQSSIPSSSSFSVSPSQQRFAVPSDPSASTVESNFPGTLRQNLHMFSTLTKHRQLTVKPKLLVKRRSHQASILSLKRRLEKAHTMPVEVKRIRTEEGPRVIKYLTMKRAHDQETPEQVNPDTTATTTTTWKSLNPAYSNLKRMSDISKRVPKRGPGRPPKKSRKSPLKGLRGNTNSENTFPKPLTSWQHHRHPRKSPLRVNMRQEDDLSAAGVGQSHPLIHPTKRHHLLPEATWEEEVTESPLYSLEGEELRGRDKALRRPKDSPHLVFEITSDDGFKVRAHTWDEAWKAVTEKVQDARVNARMKQLSYSGVDGLSMYGLNHAAVVYLVEQLFGAQHCRNYHFKYHRYDAQHLEEEPEENPSGCIRSEPFDCNSRNPYEMFSFLLSRYRLRPKRSNGDKQKEEETLLKSQRRATSMQLPMAMRFRHLRSHAKEAVGVYRSGIHGRGLYCKRDIDAGEMVIEYAGEVIRSALCDKREKYYEGKGIGCYMFRIDDLDVVDATVKGNAARFINHSCDPNCYSKVINIDGKKHIVIFALRPIKRGEELTYDYKFPIEDVKIPCTCGAKRCRRYLN